MRILRLLFLFGMLLEPLCSNASVVIHCNVRYQKTVASSPLVGYSGNGDPIFVSRSLSVSKVWSNTYSVDVYFFSGKEMNKNTNYLSYKENSIIALIKWSDEKITCITISQWVTNLDYITENEVKYNSQGGRIHRMEGYDSDRTLLEIYF